MLNTRKGGDVFNDAMMEIMSPASGIPLGNWNKFTEFTGGLRLREFTIFCGATGAGKTQFLANLAVQVLKENVKVFVAPVETGDIDFATRMLSVVAGIDLNTGIKHDRKDFSQAMADNVHLFSENVFFSTHDNRVEITEMIETLKYMSEVRGVQVAILDNLNFFLKPSSANQQILVQDEAVHEFVMLAKKIPIHLFLVMHPRKTDGGKLQSEFDIKGSSTACQEASNILLMNRPSEEEIEAGINPLSREFFFAKIRKRGFNVRRKFYLEYRGGGYFEASAAQRSTQTRTPYAPGNSSFREKKGAGVPDVAKIKSGDSEFPF